MNFYPKLREALEVGCLMHYRETMEGAAQASGVEVILPAMNRLDESEDYQDGKIEKLPRTSSHDKKENLYKPKVSENHGEGAPDGFSRVNITAKEARANPNYVHDPLRVGLKIGPVKTQKSKNEKTETDEYEKNGKWWSFMLTFGRIPRDEMGLVHVFQE